MLNQTQGIVLRSIRFGETSLVTTMFTRQFGVETYMVSGVRSSGPKKQSRAGLLQPASLLDMIAYHKQGRTMQRLREFNSAFIYSEVREQVVKNSIAVFSAELLLRILPEQAPFPELFDFCFEYFQQLDQLPVSQTSNLPVYFLVQLGNYLGYTIHGNYSAETPFLSLGDGSFSNEPPVSYNNVSTDDARILSAFINTKDYSPLASLELNGVIRQRLTEWLLQFLKRHTDHMQPVRSLDVLHAVLH